MIDSLQVLNTMIDSLQVHSQVNINNLHSPDTSYQGKVYKIRKEVLCLLVFGNDASTSNPPASFILHQGVDVSGLTRSGFQAIQDICRTYFSDKDEASVVLANFYSRITCQTSRLGNREVAVDLRGEPDIAQDLEHLMMQQQNGYGFFTAAQVGHDYHNNQASALYLYPDDRFFPFTLLYVAALDFDYRYCRKHAILNKIPSFMRWLDAAFHNDWQRQSVRQSCQKT